MDKKDFFEDVNKENKKIKKEKIKKMFMAKKGRTCQDKAESDDRGESGKCNAG